MFEKHKPDVIYFGARNFESGNWWIDTRELTDFIIAC